MFNEARCEYFKNPQNTNFEKKIKNFDVFLKLVRIQVLFQVRVFAAKTSKNPQNRDLGCTTTFKWLRRFFHLGTPNAKTSANDVIFSLIHS